MCEQSALHGESVRLATRSEDKEEWNREKKTGPEPDGSRPVL